MTTACWPASALIGQWLRQTCFKIFEHYIWIPKWCNLLIQYPFPLSYEHSPHPVQCINVPNQREENFSATATPRVVMWHSFDQWDLSKCYEELLGKLCQRKLVQRALDFCPFCCPLLLRAQTWSWRGSSCLGNMGGYEGRLKEPGSLRPLSDYFINHRYPTFGLFNTWEKENP